jgi:hypothetical protein
MLAGEAKKKNIKKSHKSDIRTKEMGRRNKREKIPPLKSLARKTLIKSKQKRGRRSRLICLK